MALILKPHLIPLILATFLAQSGEIVLKVIICRVQFSTFQRNASGTAVEATEQRQILSGRVEVRYQSRFLMTALLFPPTLIYHLQNVEHLHPLRSFTTFGELGLIISLKDSV